MTKRILKLFLLLALVAGFYVMAKAKGDGGAVDPTSTAQVVPTVTTCKVNTGVEGGAVNLRTCEGTSCAVVKILTEGASLDIVKAGNWLNVTTEDGVTGWLNSTYCK